jgi:hypothetical protein
VEAAGDRRRARRLFPRAIPSVRIARQPRCTASCSGSSSSRRCSPSARIDPRWAWRARHRVFLGARRPPGTCARLGERSFAWAAAAGAATRQSASPIHLVLLDGACASTWVTCVNGGGPSSVLRRASRRSPDVGKRALARRRESRLRRPHRRGSRDDEPHARRMPIREYYWLALKAEERRPSPSRTRGRPRHLASGARRETSTSCPSRRDVFRRARVRLPHCTSRNEARAHRGYPVHRLEPNVPNEKGKRDGSNCIRPQLARRTRHRAVGPHDRRSRVGSPPSRRPRNLTSEAPTDSDGVTNGFQSQDQMNLDRVTFDEPESRTKAWAPVLHATILRRLSWHTTGHRRQQARYRASRRPRRFKTGTSRQRAGAR